MFFFFFYEVNHAQTIKCPRFTWPVSILTVAKLASQTWWINGKSVCSSKSSNMISKLFCEEASCYRVGLAPKIRSVFHELFLPSLLSSCYSLTTHLLLAFSSSPPHPPPFK